MDDREKMKNWVREKLDEGLDKERIRKSLRETDHDPSIVDDVESPFEAEEVDENPFEPGSEETDEEESKLEKFSQCIPHKPEINFSRRGLLYLIPLLLLVSAVSGFYLFQLGEEPKSCPDVGVEVVSASVEDRATVAEVKVYRGSAEVVLEVLRNGEVVGSATSTVQDSRTLRVDAVGDRVSFHPAGCTRFVDHASVSKG